MIMKNTRVHLIRVKQGASLCGSAIKSEKKREKALESYDLRTSLWHSRSVSAHVHNVFFSFGE